MSQSAAASKQPAEASAGQADAPEAHRLPRAIPPPNTAASPKRTPLHDAEKMICERCGQSEMYRMHAVWRCPACGFKTDCCGW